MNTNRTRLTASYVSFGKIDQRTFLPSSLILAGTNTHGAHQEVRVSLDEPVQRIIAAQYVYDTPEPDPTFTFFGRMDTWRGRLAKWLLNGGAR